MIGADNGSTIGCMLKRVVGSGGKSIFYLEYPNPKGEVYIFGPVACRTLAASLEVPKVGQ